MIFHEIREAVFDLFETGFNWRGPPSWSDCLVIGGRFKVAFAFAAPNQGLLHSSQQRRECSRIASTGFRGATEVDKMLKRMWRWQTERNP